MYKRHGGVSSHSTHSAVAFVLKKNHPKQKKARHASLLGF